ncbi:LacI family DNA-binding transcriptional regulator [Marinomonas vulgaris]|uniref:LacI family DNA-binding transcriptional regulator n=1 Tax=Marinomonas vulgaris TaxID=2823372 RepID=UPI001F2896BA|nr:LacI family DNA-binding transcriptional regulator [Marinomonas vulgaris]
MTQKSKSFATISDVAKHAQVGKTSVSRYLNGEQDKLSASLQEKIALAIEQLDFRPNHSARMLKAGQSKVIGLLLADVTNPYSIEVLQGIEQVCQREGYMLMVCNTDNQEALQDRYLSLLEGHRVDGIIVNTAGMAHKQISNLQRISCPLVLVDRIDTSLGFDSVGLDNRSAVQQACTHLQHQAYDAILVITESIAIDPRQARVDAIRAFFTANSAITCQIAEINNTRVATLVDVIADFMRTHTGQKMAIFTTNGVVMMSAVKALQQLTLAIGSDIGLISIDDPEWAQLFEGGITVMRQPTREIGQTACTRLLSRIQGDQTSAQQLTLKAELIVRRST